MARSNGSKTEQSTQKSTGATAVEAIETDQAPDQPPDQTPNQIPDQAADADAQTVDDSLNALKALLSAVEKLQKVRQEVGDIKPLVMRMLDGEVISGEELEQLKTGVAGLSRLVRAYSDHRSALVNAQPARDLLDQVLKATDARG